MFSREILKITPLRRKRLLLLAKKAGGNHKAYYSQFCVLNREGLTGWAFGMAYLTEKGEKELDVLQRDLESTKVP